MNAVQPSIVYDLRPPDTTDIPPELREQLEEQLDRPRRIEKPLPESNDGREALTALFLNGTSNAVPNGRQRPLAFPPPVPQSRDFFRAIQKWEGHVIDVGQDTFRATIVPTAGEGTDLEAEIYLEEVEREDRKLIEPGAIFYWSIGYLDKPSGRQNVSVIRFRRFAAWTRHEIREALAEADRLQALFSNE